MAKLAVIGAGAVGRVVVDRCARRPEVFSDILWLSRSLGRLEDAGAAYPEVKRRVVDAANSSALASALRSFEADVVVHAALPYQNLPIMQACLEAGVHYVDTSVPESPDELWCDPHDDYWYGSQWKLNDEFEKRGLTAVEVGDTSMPAESNHSHE
jgi:saccharopine dehydrogenase (NAD+, L-lysine-forming)